MTRLKLSGCEIGAFSVINYGLTACSGGFGPYLSWSCNEGIYNSASGVINFNITKENPFDNFFETFEGPSLVGGFDSRWVGRGNCAFTSMVVNDPKVSTNNVVKAAVSWTGDI